MNRYELNNTSEYNFKACRLFERLKDELGMAEYHKIQAIDLHNKAKAVTWFTTACVSYRYPGLEDKAGGDKKTATTVGVHSNRSDRIRHQA